MCLYRRDGGGVEAVPVTKSANTAKSEKRKVPKSAWKPGQSGNPAGRPKDGESWAAIIAAVGNMYPEDILEFVGKNNDLGKVLVQLPKNVQMKYLVTARVYAALMFEPTTGLWKELMERAEGKVTEKLDVTSGGEKIGTMDEQTTDRAITTLADAVREKISGTGPESNSKVGASE